VTTYNDEYQKTSKHKNRGNGVTTLVLAIISTELKIASDFFQAVADFLGPKYEEGKQKGAEYVQYAQDTAEHYKEVGKDRLEEAKKIGQQKSEEAQQVADEKTEKAKKEAEKTKDEAQRKVQK